MWDLVSVTLEQAGKKIDMYGANPQGQAIFAPNGRFSIMFIRSDVPKFASTNREAGTAERKQGGRKRFLRYIDGCPRPYERSGLRWQLGHFNR